ncbi:MAG: MerR family transcriptional regulator [Reyranella sp.]|nr:MerR family transcriptional regulator [Reyranella sp.]
MTFLNASEAAQRLGISAKALRLYEQRGLLTPTRSEAGWRAYRPDHMKRAADIAGLRGLGFSLAQVARLLNGDPQGLEPALAAHQATLEARLQEIRSTAEKVHELRGDLARGKAPTAGTLAKLLSPTPGPHIAFDLPWPWGGERFELRDIRPLTYITGPLGSGKTRLAERIAQELGGVFLALDRRPDPSRRRQIEPALASLVGDGAAESEALIALLCGLAVPEHLPIVVDLVEQGLDRATQEALIARLRRRGPGAPPLFVMTRSCSILDLDAVGPDEAILFCPANHSPPMRIAPYPGAPGYEALASCLATPAVRARTEGVVAVRPAVA